MNNQMGIKDLLNTGAPNGEHLAYINDDEAALLRKAGGSGRTDNNPYGIPSYYGFGGGGGTDDPSDESDTPEDEQTSPQTDEDWQGYYETSMPENKQQTSEIKSASEMFGAPTPAGTASSLKGYYGINTPGYDELIPSYINTASRPPGYFGNMVSSPDAFGGNPVGGGTGLNAGLGYGRDGSDYNAGLAPYTYDPTYEYMPDDNYNQAVEDTEDFTSWLGSLFGITSPLEYDGKKFSEGTGFSLMDNPALDLGLGAVTGGLYPAIKNSAKNVYRGNYLNAIVDAIAPTSVIQANEIAKYGGVSLSDMRKVGFDPDRVTKNIGNAFDKAVKTATGFPDKVEEVYNDVFSTDPNVRTAETPWGDGTALFGGTALTDPEYANAFGGDDGIEQTSPLRLLQPTSPAIAPVEQQVLAELARPTRTGTGLTFDWTKPATDRRYFNTPTLTDYV